MGRAAIIIGVVLLGASTDAPRGTSASLLGRFLREYPAACARLGDQYRRDGKGKVILTSHYFKSEKLQYMEVKRYIYYIYGDSVRLDEEVVSDTRLASDSGSDSEMPQRKRSVIFTGGRSFSVSQNDPDKPFTFGGFKSGGSKFLDLQLGRLIEAPIHLGGSMRITDSIINNPKVVIDEVSEVRSDGRKLIKVQYHYRQPAGKAREGPTPGGWFQVDPGRGWVLDRFHSEFGRGMTLDREIKYNDKVFPIKIYENSSNSKSSMSVNRVLEFRDFEPGPVPDRVFTLAAFGLPDLGAPAAHHGIGSVASWFIGLALLCLVAALTLKWYAGRLRRA